MSPMTSISTWTKRLSLAQRSISATDFSTLCIGITIEPRSRASLSSHSLTSQSFSARQNASCHVLGEHHLHAVERIADAVS